MEDLQKLLIKIRKHKEATWKDVASHIGVSYSTLMAFMHSSRNQRGETMAKITEYIDTHKDLIRI